MWRNYARIFDNPEIGLLILNGLNGEKEAKHPKFFI